MLKAQRKNISLEKVTIYLIIGAGFLLSCMQFLFNRSIWLDESYLALNIINRNHHQLLQPLDIIQIAPILFLQIEKLFTQLIPDSEYGLRVFPLISFLFSAVFFYRSLRFIHKETFVIIICLSVFVFNPTLIYYSSEVKQYMTDIFVVVMMYYFLLKKYKNEENKYYILGIIGCIAIFLSNTSPILLSTLGAYLIYTHFKEGKKKLKLFAVFFGWAVTFITYYFLFIHEHPSRAAQVREWILYKAFVPTNIFSREFYIFFVHEGKTIVTSLFEFGAIGGLLLTLFIFSGIVILIKQRNIKMIILTILPIILHLILSYLKLYPFDKRIILYSCPLIIILISFGVNYYFNITLKYLSAAKLKIVACSMPLLIIMPLVVFKKFPIENIEIKKSIAFVKKHFTESDKIYANYFAGFPLSYYHQIKFVNIDSTKIIHGKLNQVIFKNDRFVPDTINYKKEIDQLSGRVWFIFTSIGDEEKKKDYFLRYVNSKNKKSIYEYHTKRSDVFLYDI